MIYQYNVLKARIDRLDNLMNLVSELIIIKMQKK